IRRDRHRRNRLDPRRPGGRDHRRHSGHARPRISEADARHRNLGDRRAERRAGARLHADLSHHGGDPGGAAGGPVPGAGRLMKLRIIGWTLAVALLVALPPVVNAMGQPFYIDLVRRIMILAIAAISLNLILGYGGLVSFGHAAYLGVGSYAVGIMAFYGLTNGFLQWAVAIGASALVALAIGAVSIRASGVYFIMITLAFTQMLYYLGISLAEFGGDDGMRLKARSQFSGLIDLSDPVAFYYLALALMLLAVFITYKIVNSRFGMVLRAAKSNDARTRAVGF